MRDAVSQPSFVGRNKEVSYINKRHLFFSENNSLFYHLKLEIPSIPLTQGFEDLFAPPFCSFRWREKKRVAAVA